MKTNYIAKAKENLRKTEIFVDVAESIIDGFENNVRWTEEDIEQSKDSLIDNPDSLYYKGRVKELNFKLAVYNLLKKEITDIVEEILKAGIENYIKDGNENE